jgi:DNA-binding CsgD family transcriptional regulator/MFS family permease
MRYDKQRNSTTGDRQTFRVTVSLELILGISFYLTFVLQLFQSPLFTDSVFADSTTIFLRAIAAAGSLCLALLGYFFGQSMKRGHKPVLRTLSVVLAPCLGILLWLDSSGGHGNLLLFGILMVCSGGCATALILVWGDQIFPLRRKQVIFLFSASSLIAGLIYFVVAFCAPALIVATTILLPLLSLFFEYQASSLERKQNLKTPQQTSIDETSTDGYSKKVKLPKKALAFNKTLAQIRNVTAVTYSLCFGFAAAAISNPVYYPTNVLIIAFAGVVVGLILITLLTKTDRNYSFILIWFFLPCFIMLLFGYIVSSGYFRLSILGFWFVTLMACEVLDASSKVYSFIGSSSIQCGAKIRIPNLFGFLIGWLLYLINTILMNSFHYIELITCLCIVVFVVIVMAFREFHLMKREVLLNYSQPATDTYIDQGSDSVKAASKASTAIDSTTVSADNNSVFEEKIKQLIKQYKLTSRQGEVLRFLARGRNANYIKNKLVVSSYTAKSHIYNTYGKLGVHSQQDLIDMVESMET